MTVKELIAELLDCDMEATVDFDINTSEETITISDFELNPIRGYLTFALSSGDFAAIHKDDFASLNQRIEELEGEIEDLKNE